MCHILVYSICVPIVLYTITILSWWMTCSYTMHQISLSDAYLVLTHTCTYTSWWIHLPHAQFLWFVSLLCRYPWILVNLTIPWVGKTSSREQWWLGIPWIGFHTISIAQWLRAFLLHCPHMVIGICFSCDDIDMLPLHHLSHMPCHSHLASDMHCFGCRPFSP